MELYQSHAIFLDEIAVYCVCDDGTYIGHLEHKIRQEQTWKINAKKDYVELREFIENTSKCKTCGGKQGKTLGLCTCKECGLPGNCPWPG